MPAHRGTRPRQNPQRLDQAGKVSPPNDAFFKAVFSEPEHAIAFFRKHRLPPLPRTSTGKPRGAADLLRQVEPPTGAFGPAVRGVHRRQEVPALPALRAPEHSGAGDAAALARLHPRNPRPTPPRQGPALAAGPALRPAPGPEAWNVSTAFEDLFLLPGEIAADLSPFLPKFRHAARREPLYSATRRMTTRRGWCCN